MNKRQALRFETAFPVLISSEQFGETNAMARNVSAGGILLEISRISSSARHAACACYLLT